MDYEGFNSWEEAMEAIQNRRKVCDAKTFTFQENLRKGDCFATDPGLGFFIFGEILEEPEDGYAFGKCHSIAIPNGEYGDSHISVLIPISRKEFELARARGWRGMAGIVIQSLARNHRVETKSSDEN